MSFYTKEKLKEIGFKSIGENVLISDKCSIYSPEKISIGNNVRIDDFCILSGNIKIGNYVHIAAYGAYYGAGEIEIHDFSGTSSRVTIYSQNESYNGETMTNPTIPEKYKKISYGKVIIKKHSIIGANSIILPGVIIGEGTAVGAMSLIKNSTEKWSIYTGIPAQKLKDRKKDLLELEKQFLKESIE
ncbi:acyltransferase [Fusobacterium sp.]|uniref:acyltransferase n=1 Tax=Fusobacterium sp. TaxID=68766 RepID=UPI0028FDDB3D|nr:acyltransferase [Fusobacterium sp.]MDU1912164.1 acyltransferase [Fusobacterium sp.]